MNTSKDRGHDAQLLGAKIQNDSRLANRIAEPIAQLAEATRLHTDAVKEQTKALEKAIATAAKVGPWAMAAVIIAGVGVAWQIIHSLL